jgi:molybdopterin-guanine dinucleotide biosynthesis protein A
MNISAVLLAGGESRRMGQDKATLVFRGQSLWQTQVGLLRRLEPKEIFVSARTDPPWRPAEVQFVCDEPPSRGPLSGLAATLGQIRTGHLLALGVDMPLMTSACLRSLCGRIEVGCGIVPMIGDRAEPLAAIYPKDAYLDFVAALSGKEFSLQSLTKKLVELGKLRRLQVTAEDEELFRNFNEPHLL